MKLYNDLWKTTYSLAFYIGLIYILCSFTFFEIELGHPWHFEVHLPEYYEQVDKDPIWGTEHMAENREPDSHERDHHEVIEPRKSNE